MAGENGTEKINCPRRPRACYVGRSTPHTNIPCAPERTGHRGHCLVSGIKCNMGVLHLKAQPG